MDYSIIKKLLGILVAAGVFALVRALIFKLASSKIQVEVSEKDIIFKTCKKTIRLAPFLYISATPPKRLISVGQVVTPKEQHIKINLLNSQGELGSSEEYYECLSAFFRFAFTKIMNRKLFVLPKMSLTGIEKFKYESKEINNQKALKAFKQAGVIECQFGEQ